MASLPPQPTALPRDPYVWPFRLAGVLILIGLVFYGARCVRKGWWEPPPSNGASRHSHTDGTDFTAYYSAGELARQGRSVYDYQGSSTPRRPFIYPSSFAVFPMAPLSLLPHNVALGVFFALNIVLLGAVLWMLRRLCWPPDGEPEAGFWRRPEVGLLAAVLVCGRFLDSNLVLGNANLVVLFCLCLGFYWFQRRPVRVAMVPAGGSALENRTPAKFEFLGGLAVALATSYKVTPGLFGLYLLWSRRRWGMLGGAAGLLFFLLVMPAMLLGPSGSWNDLVSFSRHVLVRLGVESDEEARAPDGQKRSGEVGWGKRVSDEEEGSPRAVGISLRGTLSKLLASTVAQRNGEDVLRVNIAEWELSSVLRLVSILSLLILVATVVLTYPAWTRVEPLAAALAWGLVSLCMLLISPLTRKAHLVILLIPAAALVALLQQGKLKGPARGAAWAGLLALGGAGMLSSSDLIGDRASDYIHSVGIFTWAMLVFYGAVATVIWSLRPPQDSARPA